MFPGWLVWQAHTGDISCLPVRTGAISVTIGSPRSLARSPFCFVLSSLMLRCSATTLHLHQLNESCSGVWWHSLLILFLLSWVFFAVCNTILHIAICYHEEVFILLPA